MYTSYTIHIPSSISTYTIVSVYISYYIYYIVSTYLYIYISTSSISLSSGTHHAKVHGSLLGCTRGIRTFSQLGPASATAASPYSSNGGPSCPKNWKTWLKHVEATISSWFLRVFFVISGFVFLASPSYFWLQLAFSFQTCSNNLGLFRPNWCISNPKLPISGSHWSPPPPCLADNVFTRNGVSSSMAGFCCTKWRVYSWENHRNSSNFTWFLVSNCPFSISRVDFL